MLLRISLPKRCSTSTHQVAWHPLQDQGAEILSGVTGPQHWAMPPLYCHVRPKHVPTKQTKQTKPKNKQAAPTSHGRRTTGGSVGKGSSTAFAMPEDNRGAIAKEAKFQIQQVSSGKKWQPQKFCSRSKGLSEFIATKGS